MKTPPRVNPDAAVLRRRLERELRGLRLRIVANAAVAVIAATGLLALGAVLSVDGWPQVGPLAARIFQVALVGAALWIVVVEAVLPLSRLRGLRDFSLVVERHESLDNLLVAAVEFTGSGEEAPVAGGVSEELVEEVLRRARRSVEARPLAARIPLPRLFSHFTLAVLAITVWLVLGLTAPRRIDATLEALSHPSRLKRTAPTTGLYALDGDLSVPVGSVVRLRARDLIGGDPAVRLEVSWTGDYWQQMDTTLRTLDRLHAPYLSWEGVIPQASDPFRYRFRKGELLTPVYRVEVRERPVIRTVELRVVPPAYTGHPPQPWKPLAPTVEVLAGSRLFLRGEASTPLRHARRISPPADPVELAVDGPSFADTLTVLDDLDFSLLLVDRQGGESEGAAVYHVVAVPDELPTVKITRPQLDLTLDRQLRVGIEGVAMDDVGLRRIDLLWRRSDARRWKRMNLVKGGGPAAPDSSIGRLQVDAGRRELALSFEWRLGELELFPGDALSYCLEAVDDKPGGGQRGRSRVHTLRLPTIAEVLHEQRERSTLQRDELGEMLHKGEELQSDLERLRRELMKNPEPDWARRQEIEELLKDQEELRRQARRSAERMQAQLEEFQRNNSGEMALLEKMETVQELLESLQDESLQSYLKAMDEAMGQLSPDELRRAMEEATGDQEEMNRRLDRTLSLLRQLEREKAMSDLVEEAREYLARQQELQDRLPKSESASKPSSEMDEGGKEARKLEAPADSTGSGRRNGAKEKAGDEHSQMSEEELARLQEELARRTEELEKKLRQRLDELKEQMESQEMPDASAEEMRKALEEALRQMENGGSSSQSMEEARRRMSEEQWEETRKSMDEAMKQLISLYQVLAKGQKGMTQASMKFAVDTLQKTAYDLLQISFEEEAIVHALDTGVNDQRLTPLTRRQFHLTRSTRRLSDDLARLASQNFFVGERLLESLRELVEAMETTVRRMEAARPKRARTEAETSMGMMNQVVIGLLTTAQQQGEGSGGGSASQQMQQMVEQQSRLNSMTEELQRRSQAGLSGEERRQLAQLKAMQEQIRRQLEEFRRSLEDQRKVLGDLQRLGEDMRREEEMLDDGRITPETRRLQDRILSRLLDAEKSVRERDYARRRESKTGRRLFGGQEGRVGAADELSADQQIRRWRAPGRAPREYQDEVRRYFRRIQGELGEGRTP